jgi:preprotein translocase SecF subunit
MEILSQGIDLHFIERRIFFYALSLILIVVSIWAWISRGDGRYGVDFSGGTELALEFNGDVAIQDFRAAIDKSGIVGATVQQFADQKNRYSIRIKTDEGRAAEEKLKEIARQVQPQGFTVLKEEYVGPVIGEQIRRDGILAFLLGLIGILVYLWVRFDLSYAVGAIIALAHDAVIGVGLYLLVGFELNATAIAAVLTLVGYSVNDTVIVYDRIRENLAIALKSGGVKKQGPRFKDLGEIMSISINQTLSRTVLTSFTAFLVSLVMAVYGGGAVADIAVILSIGIVVGTYSSIFVASALVYDYESRRKS